MFYRIGNHETATVAVPEALILKIKRRSPSELSGRIFIPFRSVYPPRDDWRVVGLLTTKSLALLPRAVITPCCR